MTLKHAQNRVEAGLIDLTADIDAMKAMAVTPNGLRFSRVSRH